METYSKKLFSSYLKFKFQMNSNLTERAVFLFAKCGKPTELVPHLHLPFAAQPIETWSLPPPLC